MGYHQTVPVPPPLPGPYNAGTFVLNRRQHQSFPSTSQFPLPALSSDASTSTTPSQETEDSDIQEIPEPPQLDTPRGNIPENERLPSPAALSKPLMPHQRIALTWLVRQEKGPHKGAILADDMGLGKTMQALALILERPPTNTNRKTTLICAPTGLLAQWENEIRDKIKPSHQLSVLKFHGRKKVGMTVAKLLEYDIVLATYGTLAWEYTRVHEKKTFKGVFLLQTHAVFHRIILDEAHNIKKPSGKASLGASHLRATYRLCMTGTPLMNRTLELYPLIRFLQIDKYEEQLNFKSLTEKAIRNLLKDLMLRRTEKSKVDGKPIFTLPKLTVVTEEAEFNDDQTKFYQALEQRTQLEMNMYIKQGNPTRIYMHALLLLLRLRQACDHPFLLNDLTIPTGVDMTPSDMIKLARKLQPGVVGRIERRHRLGFTCPNCKNRTTNPVIIYPCGHYVCSDCISAMAANKETYHKRDDDDDDDKGAIIGDCPGDECTTRMNSKHLICYQQFKEVHLYDNDEEDQYSSQDEREDRSDADKHGNLKGFVVEDDEMDEEKYEDDEEPDAPKLPTVKKEFKAESNADYRFGSNRRIKKESMTESDTDDPFKSDLIEEDNKIESDTDDPFKSDLIKEENKTESDTDDPFESDSAKQADGAIEETPTESGADSDDSLPSISQVLLQIGKKRKGGVYLSDSSDQSARDARRKRTKLGKTSRRNPLSDSDDESTGENDGPSVKNRLKPKPQGLRKADASAGAFQRKFFQTLRKDWEPSSKTDKAMEILEMIRREYPDEKTIVFSQFTSFLDLMEIPIQDARFKYCRYDGSMTAQARNEAVEKFMFDRNMKVMLISLKAGNAGLNLYAATRVIMLDPFWNPSVEDQAIARAHRLGQTKPVTAYRILVKNTVEDRILALQQQKREIVQAVLGAEAASTATGLSMNQIMNLFGSFTRTNNTQ
ncbi:hypothetical protein F5Y18DRAFT_310085 [Xylariaceae sp. FL1019]|nr:hypothetical protein F5Y18DRAFT_310085 [Xylariaceae sp. FL1019]